MLLILLLIKFQSPRTEEDIVAALPDKATTLEIMSMTKLFSTRPANSLSHWEFQAQYDTTVLKAEMEWALQWNLDTEIPYFSSDNHISSSE